MPLYHFILNISCNDSSLCQTNIITKLESAFSGLKLTGLPQNSMMSLHHEKNNHWLRLSIFENDGEAIVVKWKTYEIADPNKKYDAVLKGERDGKPVKFGYILESVKVLNPKVKKSPIIPTRAQIEAIVRQ